MNAFEQLLQRVPTFCESGHVEKIILFGWYLQAIEMNTRFSGSDILRCYDNAQTKRPSNVSQQLSELVRKSPPDILRDSKGYYLERRIRIQFDARYLDDEGSIETIQSLENLPKQIANLDEKSFLSESLVCYKHGAYRSTIVMTWNLAYSHFCEWLLLNHLAAFNAQWPIRHQGHHKQSKVKLIEQYDHFSELKELEVIEIARSAGLIDQNIFRSLTEKLGKRNIAAHPSSNAITKFQTDEVIHDLVVNVLLRLR
jgi:hypothetical protein